MTYRSPRTGRRFVRWALYVCATAVLSALVGIGAAYWGWRDLNTAAPPPPGGAMVAIAPGEAFRIISDRLEAAGVVRHAWTLRAWARWSHADRSVRPGDYRFDQPLSPLDVLLLLRSPTAALHRVTIPEGSTLLQVATLFAAAGFGGADQFLCLARDAEFLLALDLPASGLEGYLFPDTYAFSWRTTPAQILSAMVARFHQHAAALRDRRLAASMSEPDMVILGSVIEKEAATAEERAVISAVFHNRLRVGMPLQSDPTAVYGREVQGAPTAADLTVESPYNTYLHVGLPSGPICNPGGAALAAAVAPAKVSYLYFVARNDGTHAFSNTLEEHNRNVARYQRSDRVGTH